jgi:lysophospholipase L1-like esterase
VLISAGLIVALVVAALLVLRSRSGGDGARVAVARDSIVMLGDSITEQGDWERLLPGRPVVNHGHSGFTSAELVPVAREVARAQPGVVFVLTGTNDIRDSRPASWTAANLQQIVAQFERFAPGTVVVLQTVLPRADNPVAVEQVNQVIRQTAAEHQLLFVDLHRAFDDGAGGLRGTETTDGIHLTEAGYERWAPIVAATLSSLPSTSPPGTGQASVSEAGRRAPEPGR